MRMQETFLPDGAGSALDHSQPPARNLSSSFEGFKLSTFVSGGQRRRNQLTARGFGGKLAAGGGHRKVGRSGGGARQTKSLFVSVSQSVRRGQFAANQFRRLPSAGVVTSRSALGASPRNAGAELEAKSQTLFVRCSKRSCSGAAQKPGIDDNCREVSSLPKIPGPSYGTGALTPAFPAC